MTLFGLAAWALAFFVVGYLTFRLVWWWFGKALGPLR